MSMWSNGSTSGPVDESEWDAATADLDPNIVRALRAEGVRIEHVKRAAGFIDGSRLDGDTVEGFKVEARFLKRDVPSLFLPGSSAAGSPTPSTQTAQERGRALAIELGWAKPQTTT